MTRSWADDACLARLSGVSWIYWLRSDGATEHWRSHAVCMSNTVSYGFGPTATSRVRGAISPARSSASRIADSATESGASPSRAKANRQGICGLVESAFGRGLDLRGLDTVQSAHVAAPGCVPAARLAGAGAPCGCIGVGGPAVPRRP